MSKEAEKQADALAFDFKSRLKPYVDAMKSRGYFGEKLRATQHAQFQVQDEKTGAAGSAQPQTSASGRPAVKPQGTQLPMTGADPAAPQQSNGSLNHGIDQPDGDFISVSKEVKPDSSDTSRAPQTAAAARPKPASFMS